MHTSPSISDFLEWDVRNWAAALDFWLGHTRQTLRGASVLEIGSRNGGLSLWLALQGAKVCCSDIDFPNKSAMMQHEAFGVSEQIEYRSVDASDIQYANEFDIICFKSVLGGIGRIGGAETQAKAIEGMYRALKKHGELFFAENLTSSPLHRLTRRRFVKWGSVWRYVSIPEMQKLLSPFSSIEYDTAGFACAFGRNERQRNALGILDARILARIVPENWRYIMFGVARK
jgi:SAM-dependent methyltransferase